MDQSSIPPQALKPVPETLPEASTPQSGRKLNVLSLVSLITSLAPFVLIWIKYIRCIGAFCPLAAIIFGAIGLSQIKKANGAETGKGMATAGIIIGSVFIFISIILLVLAISGLSLGLNFLRNYLPSLGSFGI